MPPPAAAAAVGSERVPERERGRDAADVAAERASKSQRERIAAARRARDPTDKNYCSSIKIFNDMTILLNPGHCHNYYYCYY